MYCQLNKPVSGAQLKQWMRDVAKRYYASGSEKRTVKNVADFYFNGTDIVTWMTVYFNSITNNGTYKMVQDDTFHDGKGRVYPQKMKGVK